jgi:hypothetical protein
MKRIMIAIACAIFFIPVFLQAWDSDMSMKGIYFGGKAGVTYPMPFMAQTVSQGAYIPGVDYCAGLTAEYFFIDDILSASAGLMYVNEMQSVQWHDAYATLETDFSQYFSFPVCVKGFLSFGRYRPHLILGAAFDAAKYTDIYYDSTVDSQSASFQGKASYISCIAGLGCYYVIDRNNIITCELVFKDELEQISAAGWSYIGNKNYYRSTFLLDAGYNF